MPRAGIEDDALQGLHRLNGIYIFRVKRPGEDLRIAAKLLERILLAKFMSGLLVIRIAVNSGIVPRC